MAFFERYGSQSYAPSAPALPEEHNYGNTSLPPPPSAHHHRHHNSTGSYGQQTQTSYNGYGQDYSYGQSSFPPGINPDVIRSFQMVDRDRSGFIDENELQQALTSGYQTFSLRTIRLLVFLFKNPNDPLRVGPIEFAKLWSCLGEWRGIFERYDRDKSEKIDLMELRDALYSLGYAIPSSVLQLLISKYNDGSGRKAELNFDSFIECGMIVKGLTEKFKEKDRSYIGSATLTYDTFMSMVIPFLVSYD